MSTSQSGAFDTCHWGRLAEHTTQRGFNDRWKLRHRLIPGDVPKSRPYPVRFRGVIATHVIGQHQLRPARQGNHEVETTAYTPDEAPALRETVLDPENIQEIKTH
jgi:hypothetical protein